MIRLTLRQFRTEGVVGASLLAALAVVLAVTGPRLAAVHDAFVSSCGSAASCTANDPVLATYTLLQNLVEAAVMLAPALVGVFWGAPLVAREIETGTFRLAWTQSVSRRRWLATKLGLVGLAALALGGLVSLAATWWSSPINAAQQDRFSPGAFGRGGLVPAGYAAFAFLLGVTAGVILRRTVPAMAVTIAVFLGARLAVQGWLRQHLWPALQKVVPLGSAGGLGFAGSPSGPTVVVGAPDLPNAWVISSAVVDRAGHAPTGQFLQQTCPGVIPPNGGLGSRPGLFGGKHAVHALPGGAQFQACMAKLAARFHEVVTYQPAYRYWPFQWAETAIFLAAGLALAGVCFWWVRRRLS
jgi:hypothetical protein